MEYVWSGLRKLGVISASADAVAQCGPEFPEMWRTFVDHVIDSAYTGRCPANSPAQAAPLPPLRLPAASRLVAVGDLHGDLPKAQRAFRLAGLTNDRDEWVGGDAVCVQVGDILDRGPDELKLLYWLERLQHEAERAGGRLYVLNGNHETMNIHGNYRYATAGADQEMSMWLKWQQLGDKLREQCGCSRLAGDIPPDVRGPPPEGMYGGRQFNPMRHGALRPGGPVTRRFLASHPIVLQVGSTVFVHGGVLPSHLEYGLDRINQETRQWMLKHSNQRPPTFLTGADAIVWAREYSMREQSKCDCETLQQVLEDMPGATRMVVGHTIQNSVNGACGQRVLRVDVGMSQGCGNSAVEVLEILGDQQVVRLSELHGRQVLQGDEQMHLNHAAAVGMTAAAAAAAAAAGQPPGAQAATATPRQSGSTAIASASSSSSSDRGPIEVAHRQQALVQAFLRQFLGAAAAADAAVGPDVRKQASGAAGEPEPVAVPSRA